MKLENERFTVVRSRCPQNSKFGDITSLLCKVPQEYVTKRAPHVQHDSFLSFKAGLHGTIGRPVLSGR